MHVVAIVLSVITAALCVGSATAKLRGQEMIVDGLVSVGVPRERVSLLAVPLLAGALGLLVGIFWTPLGIAAAIGLVVYFALALGAHFRADQSGADLVPPGLFLALSVLTLVFLSV